MPLGTSTKHNACSQETALKQATIPSVNLSLMALVGKRVRHMEVVTECWSGCTMTYGLQGNENLCLYWSNWLLVGWLIPTIKLGIIHDKFLSNGLKPTTSHHELPLEFFVIIMTTLTKVVTHDAIKGSLMIKLLANMRQSEAKRGKVWWSTAASLSSTSLVSSQPATNK
jgi:hypothetical protein